MSTSPQGTESGFAVSVREISRQPGSRRDVSRTFPAPAVLGSDVIGVPEGSEIGLDASLDAVTDGVWVSGTLPAEAVGECGRCLDEVRLNVAAPLQGLFVYPDSPSNSYTSSAPSSSSPSSRRESG